MRLMVIGSIGMIPGATGTFLSDRPTHPIRNEFRTEECAHTSMCSFAREVSVTLTLLPGSRA